MGGRGTGTLVTMGMKDGIVQGSKAKWETVVADYNPQAGQKEVRIKETYEAFADIARDKHNNQIEVLAIIHDDGYVTHVANGRDGAVAFSREMEADMAGHHVTHYHNRLSDTPVQRKERAEDDKKYASIERAVKRFKEADAEIARIEKEQGVRSRTLSIWTGSDDDKHLERWLNRNDISDDAKDKVIALKKQFDSDEQAWKNAWRRKRTAAQDIENRVYEYNGERRSINTWKHGEDIKMPEKRYKTPNEQGFVGGCPSLADYVNSPLKSGALSFSATCEEGTYTIRATQNADYTKLQGEMINQWSVDSLGNPRGEVARKFQGALRTIDRKTNREGEQKGWTKQQRKAISFNRQMAHIWNEDKKLLKECGFIATFTDNPNYKPIFTED